MTCPFQVGDCIHELREIAFVARAEGIMHFPPIPGKGILLDELDPSKPDATVTALTERGFTYRYDHPIQFVRPDWGTTDGGECFEGGFHLWRKVS